MELLDRQLLQACMQRDHFKVCNEFRHGNVLCNEAKMVLKVFDRYYRDFKILERINKDQFIDWCVTIQPEHYEEVSLLVTTFSEKVYPVEEFKTLLKNVTVHRTITSLQDLIDEYSKGDLENPIESVKLELDTVAQAMRNVDSGLVDTSSYSDIFAREDKDGGLPWFSKGISEIMHTLLKGRFVIVGASTDCGKTTFLLNNVKHWLSHLEEGEKICWVNNEEVTSALRMRLAQSVLEMSEYEVINNFCKTNERDELIRDDSGKFILREDDFKQAIHDKLGYNLDDKIVFLNAHKASYFDIEMELAKDNYRVVLFDMLDHIKFPSTDNGQQADIEAKYNWARSLASIYDCSVLATSQTSREGNNNRVPNLEDLKDSKVGKQTTCDALIMLGMNPELGDNIPLIEGSTLYNRTVSVPKNKMRNVRTRLSQARYANSMDGTIPLLINPVTAVFLDYNDTVDERGQLK